MANYVNISVEYPGKIMQNQVLVASELFKKLVEDDKFLSREQRNLFKNKKIIKYNRLDDLLSRGKVVEKKDKLILNALPYEIVSFYDIPGGLNIENGNYRNLPVSEFGISLDGYFEIDEKIHYENSSDYACSVITSLYVAPYLYQK